MARLAEALPRLRVARERLVVAAELWSRVDVLAIPAPARSAISPLAAQIPKLVTALDQAIPLLEVMVPFAGYPTSQRYVFLLQNRDEIRPAGALSAISAPRPSTAAICAISTSRTSTTRRPGA